MYDKIDVSRKQSKMEWTHQTRRTAKHMGQRNISCFEE